MQNKRTGFFHKYGYFSSSVLTIVTYFFFLFVLDYIFHYKIITDNWSITLLVGHATISTVFFAFLQFSFIDSGIPRDIIYQYIIKHKNTQRFLSINGTIIVVFSICSIIQLTSNGKNFASNGYLEIFLFLLSIFSLTKYSFWIIKTLQGDQLFLLILDYISDYITKDNTKDNTKDGDLITLNDELKKDLGNLFCKNWSSKKDKNGKRIKTISVYSTNVGLIKEISVKNIAKSIKNNFINHDDKIGIEILIGENQVVEKGKEIIVIKYFSDRVIDENYLKIEINNFITYDEEYNGFLANARNYILLIQLIRDKSGKLNKLYLFEKFGDLINHLLLNLNQPIDNTYYNKLLKGLIFTFFDGLSYYEGVELDEDILLLHQKIRYNLKKIYSTQHDIIKNKSLIYNYFVFCKHIIRQYPMSYSYLYGLIEKIKNLAFPYLDFASRETPDEYYNGNKMQLNSLIEYTIDKGVIIICELIKNYSQINSVHRINILIENIQGYISFFRIWDLFFHELNNYEEDKKKNSVKLKHRVVGLALIIFKRIEEGFLPPILFSKVVIPMIENKGTTTAEKESDSILDVYNFDVYDFLNDFYELLNELQTNNIHKAGVYEVNLYNSQNFILTYITYLYSVKEDNDNERQSLYGKSVNAINTSSECKDIKSVISNAIKKSKLELLSRILDISINEIQNILGKIFLDFKVDD